MKNKKPMKYGLSNGEQLYIHDQDHMIKAHNYLIQNFIMGPVYHRLGLDPLKVNAVLAKDMKSIFVLPFEEQNQDHGVNGHEVQEKVEPDRPLNQG